MILKNCKVFNGEVFNEELLDVRIEENKIVQIGTDISKGGYSEKSIIDIEGKYVVPGFVDIHTHGIKGIDFSYSQDYDVDDFLNNYVSRGTTSVYLTTVTMDADKTHELIKKFSTIKHPAFKGIHLEGPFLNELKLGAHKREYILNPSIDAFKKIVGECEHIIKRVTIACEKDLNYELSDYLNKRGIIASFGHTNCNACQAYQAFSHGYKLSTHHFNAMPLLHHRDVSITGAALNDPSVTCEYIPDFYHVSKDMLEILFKCKDQDMLVMVTDSISATCMTDGRYTLGGLSVNVENGLVKDDCGTIAGSSITMAEGVYRMINNGFNPLTVLKSATSNPSRIMGLKNKGYIKTSYDADINILDNTFRHVYTIFQGKKVCV